MCAAAMRLGAVVVFCSVALRIWFVRAGGVTCWVSSVYSAAFVSSLDAVHGCIFFGTVLVPEAMQA